MQKQYEIGLIQQAANRPEAAVIVAEMDIGLWSDPVCRQLAVGIKKLLGDCQPANYETLAGWLGQTGVTDYLGGDWSKLGEYLTNYDGTTPAITLRQLIEKEAERAKLGRTLDDAQVLLGRGHSSEDVAQRILEGLPKENESEAYTPFPVDLLPLWLREFVTEGAESIGCDSSFLALPVLTVLAAIIGHTARLMAKNDWHVPAILWTMIVGESGTAKTPAFQKVLKPLQDWQAEAFARHIQELDEYSLAKAKYEKQLQGWKQQKGTAGNPPLPPTEPQAQRIIVQDTTIEALAILLLCNPRGLLLFRDELSGWIGSFDKYSGGKGADASQWLSIHSADAITVDRKTGHPRTIYIPEAFVSISGGIQPGVLQSTFSLGHRQSGMAARFLMAYPPRKAKEWTEASISAETAVRWATIIGQLRKLEPGLLLRLSPEARTRFQAWYARHNREQAAQEGEIASAYSKLEEAAPRIALVLHLARWAAGEEVNKFEVDDTSMKSAIGITDWFKLEAIRIYSLFGVKAKAIPLPEWIRKRGGTATHREAAQILRTYRGKGGSKAAKEDFEQLVADGHCVPNPDGSYTLT